MTTHSLSPEQWINIALTVVIAVAVIAQAWFTRTQAQLLRESERRAREYEKPTVRIVPLAHSISRIGKSGDFREESFDGFTVTNAGSREIEVTSFAFEIGRILDSRKDESVTSDIIFNPVSHSTMSLPHRLKHSESFTILYDREKLVEESTRVGGESPVRMRPYCYDSLGNKHTPYHWIVYQKGNHTAFFDGPSPGRISEEEWNKLKPAKQRRTSPWSRLWIVH